MTKDAITWPIMRPIRRLLTNSSGSVATTLANWRTYFVESFAGNPAATRRKPVARQQGFPLAAIVQAV